MLTYQKTKSAPRALHISAADLVFDRCTCYGDIYILNNGIEYVSGVFLGYNKRDIYRALLRKLFNYHGATPAAGAAAYDRLILKYRGY